MDKEKQVYLDPIDYENLMDRMFDLDHESFRISILIQDLKKRKKLNNEDYFRLESLKEEYFEIKLQQKRILASLEQAVLLDDSCNEEEVAVGDIVEISIFTETKVNSHRIRLVEDAQTDCSSMDVSVYDPLGSAILGHKVGYSGYYKVGNTNYQVQILKKYLIKKESKSFVRKHSVDK